MSTSALPGLDAAIAAALTATLPATVQVSAVDPAKWQTLETGAIWVQEIEATSEWRTLGPTPKATHERRKETLNVKLRAVAYAEGRRHLDAAAAATTLVETIVSGVEDTIADDPTLGFNGHVSWALLAEVKVRKEPAASGWLAVADITLECQNRP